MEYILDMNPIQRQPIRTFFRRVRERFSRSRKRNFGFTRTEVLLSVLAVSAAVMIACNRQEPPEASGRTDTTKGEVRLSVQNAYELRVKAEDGKDLSENEIAALKKSSSENAAVALVFHYSGKGDWERIRNLLTSQDYEKTFDAIIGLRHLFFREVDISPVVPDLEQIVNGLRTQPCSTCEFLPRLEDMYQAAALLALYYNGTGSSSKLSNLLTSHRVSQIRWYAANSLGWYASEGHDISNSEVSLEAALRGNDGSGDVQQEALIALATFYARTGNDGGIEKIRRAIAAKKDDWFKGELTGLLDKTIAEVQR